MFPPKSSGGKNLQPEKSEEDDSGPRLEPTHPAITSNQFNPNVRNGPCPSLMGFVLLKGNTNTQYPWVQIHCTAIDTLFYSIGKHTLKLTKGGMVSFKPAGRVHVNGKFVYGASAIKHLSREQVLQDNEGRLGSSRTQTWAQGTVKGINGNRLQPRHAIVFLAGTQQGRTPRLSYEAATLVEGSQALPPGSPVFFQTAVKHNNKKQEQGDRGAEVITMLYDWTRYGKHAGPLPSQRMTEKVEGTIGKAHLLIGSSSVIDPRGVSIMDLVQGDDTAVEGASLDSLVKRALVILQERHEELLTKMSQNDQDNDITASITALERTLATHKGGEPLHVFISPNFIARKRWIDLTNRHFSFGGEEQVSIGRVRIFEMASHLLNEHNAERNLGLSARLVDEWKTSQHHESYQLFRNAGPFVTLEPTSLNAIQEMDCPEDTAYRATNTNHHHNHQLLVITLAADNSSRSDVPCTVVDLAGDQAPATATLEQEMKPSLLLVYPISREAQAQAILHTMQDKMSLDFRQKVVHPDARKVALRLFMSGASAEYLAEVASFINNPDAEMVFHAGLWNELHQDLDDARVRTLYCKSGFNPAHELLADLDPDIQYVAVTHGIIRILSKMSTAALLLGMREFNKKELPLHISSRPERGDSAIYQAISDDNGIHWVGMHPSPRVRGNTSAWGDSGLNRPFRAAVAEHRILIRGPAPSWTNNNLIRVLQDYDLTEEAMGAARWTTIKGEHGVFIEVAHASVKDKVADARIYDKFLVTELQPLSKDTRTFPDKPVLLQGDPPERSAHEIKVVMLEAIKSRTTGTHQPDLSQAPLIALTKEGNSREAPKVLGLLGKGTGKNTSKKQNKSASLKKSTGKKQNDSAGKKASKKKATVSKVPQGAAGGDLGKGGKKGTSKKGQGNNWLLSQGRPGPAAPPKTPKKPALPTTNNRFDLFQEDEVAITETEEEKASRLADEGKKKKQKKKKRDRQAKEKQRKEAEKEGLASNSNTASSKPDGSLASELGLTQAEIEAHRTRVVQEIRARAGNIRLSEEEQTDLETGLTWAQIRREKEKDSEGFELWVEENAARQRAGLPPLPLPSEAPTPTPEPQQPAPSTEQQPLSVVAALLGAASTAPPATAITDGSTETAPLPKRCSARLAGKEPEAGGEERGKKGEKGGQKGKALVKAGTAGKVGQKDLGGTKGILYRHPRSPPRKKGSQPKITDSLSSSRTYNALDQAPIDLSLGQDRDEEGFLIPVEEAAEASVDKDTGAPTQTHEDVQNRISSMVVAPNLCTPTRGKNKTFCAAVFFQSPKHRTPTDSQTKKKNTDPKPNRGPKQLVLEGANSSSPSALTDQQKEKNDDNNAKDAEGSEQRSL